MIYNLLAFAQLLFSKALEEHTCAKRAINEPLRHAAMSETKQIFSSKPCGSKLWHDCMRAAKDGEKAHVILRVALPCRKPNCQPLWRCTIGKSSISDTMGLA